MRLESITLSDFRNYKRSDIRFSGGRNLLLGKNGAGKSNLLEAVYVLSTSKSFRQAKDSKLVRWDTDGFMVRGVFSSTRGKYTVEVACGREGKKLFVNGTPEERVSNVIGYVYCVIFYFDDILLVKGPPASKRSFLDLVLSTTDPLYFDNLRRYLSVVRHKAKYLKDSTTVDRNLLLSLNEQLVQFGGYLVDKRSELVLFINRYIQEAAKKVYPGGPFLELKYHTNIAGEGKIAGGASTVDLFVHALERCGRQEIITAQCIAGPHRDDISFMDENHDVRHFGSIGEARLAAILLKLGQASFYTNSRGVVPILLMDDIMLELDMRNTERVIRLVDPQSQTLITTTEKSKLPEIFQYDSVFTIIDGRVN
ncbi:MAG: DNA replication and repair protein RecF [Spirochaetes bacterium]|nr:DNA replication and repair protein RecF [Spirochaetota bacterium]